MRYHNILLDVVNMAYRVFTHKQEQANPVGKKQVYKQSIKAFIDKVTELKEEYLHYDGHMYLLFDNPTSRIDLQSSFYFADRKKAYAKYKEDRSKEPKEFYNSLNLLKYYYLVNDPMFHTLQLQKLEADDLVEPVLRLYCKQEDNLLITNDLDWARYVDQKTHWMPKWGSIEDGASISDRLGFPLTADALCMYKAVFGDPSDNIPAIAPGKLKAQFSQLLSELQPTSPLELLLRGLDGYKHPILDAIKQQERQYRINLQLVEAIPVGDTHIQKTLTTGRSATAIKEALDIVLGIKEEQSLYVFGNVKRPRI